MTDTLHNSLESKYLNILSLSYFIRMAAPQHTTFLDEQTVKIIWKGFGSYIAKQLRNGKGVIVPRFGHFTFSAPNVDLAVNHILGLILIRARQIQEKEINRLEIPCLL